jgi:hypothetical protein
MDAVADLGAEDVVDQPMLGEPGKAREGLRRDDGIEVVTITRDTGHGARDPGLDAGLEFIWRGRHVYKATEVPPLYFVKHDHSHRQRR